MNRRFGSLKDGVCRLVIFAYSSNPMRFLPLAALAACAVGAFPGCDQPSSPTDPGPELPTDSSSVVPKGDRVLGIAISDRADGDFNTAYLQAVGAGMQSTGLSLSWDDLEISSGVYAPDPDFLAIAAGFYGPAGTEVLLGINPIDTNNERLPAYLDGKPWDDPMVVSAFKDLLDWALPKTEGLELSALSIGNEIDARLSSPDEWAAYTNFFQQVADHARTLRPGLRVTTKITKDGLVGSSAALAATLNGLTDVVVTTYYPLGSGFQIQSPSTVAAVFDDITARYPGHPIIFGEIGSSSTSQCGSSELLQAEFVREAFKAWDDHADQVEMLEFVWMHDISQEALNVYESYYGLSDVCFLDYLGTLGLKHPDGSDKPAWTALEEEAAARGW